MTEELTSKRYEPDSIDMDHDDSRSLTIKLVGHDKKVLEVGTSTGYVTRVLKERGNRVVGIEIDEEAGKIAAQYCESMIIGDVESICLEDHLEEASLDVIMFADVLEHLKEPGRVLEKVKKFLKPEGYLVISLPNECHGDVILSLLQGDFKYTPMGLHDATHLRFFGLKNILDMFQNRGYIVTDLNRFRSPVGYTELRVDQDKVPADLLSFIRSIPDSDVYQYIFRAIRSSTGDLISGNEQVPARELTALFSTAIEDAVAKRAEPLKQEIVELRASNSEALSQVEDFRLRLLDREHELANKDTHIHDIEAQLAEDDRKLDRQSVV